MQSRVKGKTVQVTIDLHGSLTPEQTRAEAKTLLGEMARGIHLNQVERHAKLKSVTLAEAYETYFQSPPLSENTLKAFAKAIRVGFPDWQNKPIQRIKMDFHLVYFIISI